VATDQKRTSLIRTLDASINEFNQDGRLARGRATRRARRLTGLAWTYSALLIIEGMKANAMLRMTDLAELVGTTAPTVTKLIKDLEDKGLVDRTTDEQDGRVSMVSLTEEGRRVADAIGEARLESLQQVLESWSVDDLERLEVLFERLRADMRRMS
jgi:DNA-binding MarR family transcriptional regulator